MPLATEGTPVQNTNLRSAAAPPPLVTRFDQLRQAEKVLHTYGQTLSELGSKLDSRFCDAAELIFDCAGSAVTCGMGKAGLIAQKVSATLASTGTRSHFLHPAEAIHGDLGRIDRGDVAIVFSQSGETGEVVRLLPSLAELGAPVVAITCRPMSTLARKARVVLDLGPLSEVCPLGLAPTTSTMAMLAVGDALAIVLSRMRGFRAEDFARFHPGGSLGLQLARVEDYMRPLAECRLAQPDRSVREVLVQQSRPGRRSGAVMLVDDDGRLAGLFTDSDLVRLFERRGESALDRPIREVMTARPVTVMLGARLADAVQLLAGRKFSELPVLDGAGKPVGLVDVTDVVGLPGLIAAHAQRTAERLAS